MDNFRAFRIDEQDGKIVAGFQELGVDEPDIVKTDGTHVYALLDGALRVAGEAVGAALRERAGDPAQRVIPVLLPGASDPRIHPMLPDYLKSLVWIEANLHLPT